MYLDEPAGQHISIPIRSLTPHRRDHQFAPRTIVEHDLKRGLEDPTALSAAVDEDDHRRRRERLKHPASAFVIEGAG